MRGVTASVNIRRPAKEVWAQASDPARWPAYVEAFAGYGMKFKVATVPPGPLGEGVEAVLSRASGPVVMKGRVAAWDPPRSFTASVRNSSWFSGYHGTFALKVSELDSDLCSVELAMKVVFMNRFVELSSLLLPVSFLYRRRIDKVLALLKG